MLGNFEGRFVVCRFFFKLTFKKQNLSGISSASNSLDPDQAQQNVGPDLVLNCLHGYLQTNKS